MAKQENKSVKENQSNKKLTSKGAGILVPAGLLIGMGLGFAFDSVETGLFIGLGLGLLGLAIVKMRE
jgi:hypothetical protein